nr:hypothetical protein [Tanacetum cinerariifolium]
MTLETHNWSSSAHQELHKIVKDEIFPIVNLVDARVQNFEIHFLKEAAKFVGDFKSLAKDADESLAKHKALELEIKRLLRTVVSQDFMSVVQKASVVDTSNLQTELEQPSPTPVADPSRTLAKYQADQNHFTRLRCRSLTKNEGKTSYEGELGNQPLFLLTAPNVQALLLSDEELMDESEDEESTALYANLKSEIEGFHGATYKVHKVTEAAFNTYEKLRVKFQARYGKDAKIILGSLKVIQDVVKEGPALNKKVIEANESYTKNLTNLTELLSLIKSFDFEGLNSSVESLRASPLKQDEHLSECAKSSTSMAWNLGPRLIRENDDIETQETKMEKEPEKVTTEEVPTRPTRAFPISTTRPITRSNSEVVIDITPPEPQVTQREWKGIAIGDESPKKPMHVSTIVRQDPDKPI